MGVLGVSEPCSLLFISRSVMGCAHGLGTTDPVSCIHLEHEEDALSTSVNGAPIVKEPVNHRKNNTGRTSGMR